MPRSGLETGCAGSRRCGPSPISAEMRRRSRRRRPTRRCPCAGRPAGDTRHRGRRRRAACRRPPPTCCRSTSPAPAGADRAPRSNGHWRPQPPAPPPPPLIPRAPVAPAAASNRHGPLDHHVPEARRPLSGGTVDATRSVPPASTRSCERRCGTVTREVWPAVTISSSWRRSAAGTPPGRPRCRRAARGRTGRPRPGPTAGRWQSSRRAPSRPA